MSRAALTLQRRLLARLAADAELVRLLGGTGRVLDRRPPGLPFVLVGPVDSRDLSTATETGEEHLLTLEVWTGADEPGLGLEIAAAIRAALVPLPVASRGPPLVSGPDFLWCRARRVTSARALVTAIGFRLVTEGDGP